MNMILDVIARGMIGTVIYIWRAISTKIILDIMFKGPLHFLLECELCSLVYVYLESVLFETFSSQFGWILFSF